HRRRDHPLPQGRVSAQHLKAPSDITKTTRELFHGSQCSALPPLAYVPGIVDLRLRRPGRCVMMLGRRAQAMRIFIGSHARSTVVVAALALVALGDPAMVGAQGTPPAATTTPERIKAATAGVDGTSIQANLATSKDWPTIGLDYAETRFSKLAEITPA